MPSEENEVMAKIAAGGDNAVFAFLQMAKRFYDRDGAPGLTGFIERVFPTMPHSDQISTVGVALVELFFTGKKH